MTTQDTENQTGGADPQDQPELGNGDAGASVDAGSTSDNSPATPAADAGSTASSNEAPVNPYEKLKADALQLIIDARKLGKDAGETVASVLKEIAD